MNFDRGNRGLCWQACCDRTVWLGTAKPGFVAGFIQVSLNQGNRWLRHEVNAAIVMTFLIAFASSVGTHVQNPQRSVP